MDGKALMEHLQGRGFTLSAVGSDLFVKPGAALTFADRSAIRDNKPALLGLLGPHAAPYITESGELRISFKSHPRYHHWAGGQSVVATLAELQAPLKTWQLYIARGPHLLTPKHPDICAGALQKATGVIYCPECKYFMEETV